jgi:probable rRNA maturation factor
MKFVGKEEIAELNGRFRSKSYATDVLSFPQEKWRTPRTLRSRNKKPSFGSTLGDIVICLDIAEQNAEKIGQGLDREVCFLIVHGILHLCGHDHETKSEERVMLDQQRKIMKSLEEGKDPLWDSCIKVKSSKVV